MPIDPHWDKVFPLSDQVQHRKVRFVNRFGIELAADLYQPKATSPGPQRWPALVMSGPFGAVKEQSSGLYAQTLAERGFVTLAFDPAFTGESGGAVRHVASPDIGSEDFSAAVDYLGLQAQVDRDRIGALAICGLSGMALTAASSDARIKAVVTASMYDMSRSISRGYRDSYTPAQRHAIVAYLSQQRWEDAARGRPAPGWHEVPFDAEGRLLKGQRTLPEHLPADANPVLAAFFDYYRTPRAYHPRAINSTTAWNATTPVSFFNFPLAAHVEMIAPRPVLLIAGEHAHSRYYSEDLYQAAAEPKQLLIVPGADHVDLYDRLDKIPFDEIERFFRQAFQ
ncbi:alpha/beta hydrolase [Curvibacter sp. HBC61]|uniref:Alpha/beta hydrolase n=1 Tax=Curvibacter cyanobacteriorum TaxID=3026422 RepID=A0ABT5N0L7_9BURK|nr:alpha/beta hydrolase [Curvibacter sp. HBC61]MDD0839862.1 alpha/beta hydrolase [Curvibacter sp. HBC61]